MAHQDPTWTIIPEYEGHQVNSSGEIRNIKTGNVLQTGVNDTGSRYASMRNTAFGQYRNVTVSRLVAMTFCLGQTEKENTVLHLNGRTEDNRAENLMWSTRWHTIAFHQEMAHRSEQVHRRHPITEAQGRVYANVYEAAEATGCLPSAIGYAVRYNDTLATDEHVNFVHRVWPGGHTFRSVR